MIFNEGRVNIERGRGARRVLDFSLAFYSVLFAGNRKSAESVSTILQLLVAVYDILHEHLKAHQRRWREEGIGYLEHEQKNPI